MLERVLAALALLVASPLLVVVAAAIVLSNGLPVFFRQERLGKNGVRFRIAKFRSMRVEQRGAAITAAGDARITGLGRYLRRYKIDEVPQLWNVVRGEMQLIGPRPEVPAYVDLEDPCWQAVLSVLPGITDPATLMSRNEEELLARVPDPDSYYRRIHLPRKLRLSISYQRNRTFRRDCAVLALTLFWSIAPAHWSEQHLSHLFGIEEATT
jgi:lipopolysaccharide/colanic/teichoic acid biosynthesis glycosyltransferase